MENSPLPADNGAFVTFDEFGPLDQMDPAMAGSIRMAMIYARYEGSLMIMSESGAGGDILALAIHNASRRASGPFVTVDCAAEARSTIELQMFGCEDGVFHGVSGVMMPGEFEAADGGTIFLKEVGDAPFEVQKKLTSLIRDSRVIRIGGKRYRPLDARVIASTSRDIRLDVQRKIFSRELYALLGSLRIDIPPLRERRQDIGLLAQRFLDRCNARYPKHKKNFGEGAIRLLESYHWPGNVRELMMVVERIFFSALDDKSVRISAILAKEVLAWGEAREAEEGGAEPKASLPDAYEYFERSNIRMALERNRGNVGAAASALGISRASLYRKMKNFEIIAKTYRRGI
jgi:transcriptional regulator with PAS, ATPase and Fis domain